MQKEPLLAANMRTTLVDITTTGILYHLNNYCLACLLGHQCLVNVGSIKVLPTPLLLYSHMYICPFISVTIQVD